MRGFGWELIALVARCSNSMIPALLFQLRQAPVKTSIWIRFRIRFTIRSNPTAETCSARVHVVIRIVSKVVYPIR